MDVLTDGLAWDWISEKIYWTDYCQDDIEVYDTTTGYRTVLFNTELIEPHTIVVDPTTRLVQRFIVHSFSSIRHVCKATYV